MLLESFGHDHPKKVVESLDKDLYVDDLLTSVQPESEAKDTHEPESTSMKRLSLEEVVVKQ